MTLLPLLLGRDSSTPRFLSLGTREVVSIHLNSVAHSRGRAFAGPYGRFRSPVGPQSPARVLRLRFPHNHAAYDVPRFRTRTRCDHSGSLGLHVVTAAVVRVLQHVVPAMRLALNWFGSVRNMASTPTSRPSMETGAPDYERPMYPDYFYSKGLIVEYYRFYKSIPSVCGRIRIERIAVCDAFCIRCHV